MLTMLSRFVAKVAMCIEKMKGVCMKVCGGLVEDMDMENCPSKMEGNAQTQ